MSPSEAPGPLKPDLRKYTLSYEQRRDRWLLVDDHNSRQVKAFPTKGHALTGDALQRAVGPAGGIVRIRMRSNRLHEQRIYQPRGQRR